MKKYASKVVSAVFLILPLCVNATGYEKPYTKLIDTLSIEAKVMTIEDAHTIVISTPESNDIRGLILQHEISKKNYGTIIKEGVKNYVMRVGIYGLSDDSDTAFIDSVIKDNIYNMKCQSIYMEDKINTYPMCQILINGKDIFLAMSEHPQMKKRITLSTRRIHPDLLLHSEYEKAIGNLIISDF